MKAIGIHHHQSFQSRHLQEGKDISAISKILSKEQEGNNPEVGISGIPKNVVIIANNVLSDNSRSRRSSSVPIF